MTGFVAGFMPAKRQNNLTPRLGAGCPRGVVLGGSMPQVKTGKFEVFSLNRAEFWQFLNLR